MNVHESSSYFRDTSVDTHRAKGAVPVFQDLPVVPTITQTVTELGEERLSGLSLSELPQEAVRNPSVYDRQVIINLGCGNMAAALQRKAELKNPPLHTEIISIERWRASPDPTEFFQNLTPCSRIYCIGKGAAGREYLTGYQPGESLYVREIVNALKNVPALKRPHPSDRDRFLTISVVASYGALAFNGEPSFAERLSLDLSYEGICNYVSAFKVSVMRGSDNPTLPTHKIAVGHLRSKEPKTKLAFATGCNHLTYKCKLYEYR